MPLDQVRQALDNPGFDQVAALERHRDWLKERMERLSLLLHTIDSAHHQVMCESWVFWAWPKWCYNHHYRHFAGQGYRQ